MGTDRTSKNNLHEAFAAGWRTAANWADRDDLHADVNSPAYCKDRDEALEGFSVETGASQTQPYLIRLLKEVERIVPPPSNCHHCLTFAQFGSDAAGWVDKLALQINRDGRFVCIFIDLDDFQKPPDALASDIASALSDSPDNTQFGAGPGQYRSAVKSGGDPK